LEFKPDYSKSKKHNAEQLIKHVKQWTTSFLQPLRCSTLDSLIDTNTPALVFFGPAIMVNKGGKYQHFHRMTTLDRFVHVDNPISFYYIDDTKCAKDFNLDPEVPTVVLYLNKNVVPSLLEEGTDEGKDKFGLTYLLNWISLSIAHSTMRYNRRSA